MDLKARKEGLIVKELDGEIAVYDERDHRAHERWSRMQHVEAATRVELERHGDRSEQTAGNRAQRTERQHDERSQNEREPIGDLLAWLEHATCPYRKRRAPSLRTSRTGTRP